MRKVWEADDKFIEVMDQDQEEPMAPIAGNLIHLKKAGEQIGVLPTTTFTCFGSENTDRPSDPIYKLRQLAFSLSKKGAGKAKKSRKTIKKSRKD